ncbi:hypothetical protein PsorP6_009104 [Peronosclerospora sorghi]|uniref:Uncharacterized protein n=1 Tax=Peronosclerospora sorghi TaxID=230839 RepID=A0ACC0W0M2_9STRA|nr:hypothetical protein PsorP6_009104 [Peronosclerospora sorghi]
MDRLSVGESLTNMVWVAIGGRGLRDCKCLANWMWAAKLPNEAARMYECCEVMTTFMKEVDDCKGESGGRERSREAGRYYTPDLKPHVSNTLLYYVDVGKGANRLGGSTLAQVYWQVGDVSPDVEDATLFKNAFNGIPKSIKQGHILAGHDRSDGVLIVTLLEKAFGGNCGFDVDLPFGGDKVTTKDVLQMLFADELGFVFQVAAVQHDADVETIFSSLDVPVMKLGKVTTDGVIKVNINGEKVLKDEMVDLRAVWEATGFEFEKRQCNPDSLRTRTGPSWTVTYEPQVTPERQLSTSGRHRVVVLREEGSKGEREMFAAFHHDGFEVWDVTMSDLVHKRMVLDRRFRGVAFVGGFTFADVLGSSKGWAGVVKFHPDVLAQFAAFKARDDTFSFGVCNGCEFMTMLGWVTHPDTQALEREIRTSAATHFVHNESGRHESRFVTVQIQASNAVVLRGMAGTCIGVWVSHDEGRSHFSHAKMQETYLATGAAEIRYVDESNHPTEAYPFNPNGSSHGIAGLVSTDGRHLCFMPHPERCFLKYQWPYVPPALQAYPVSPWIRCQRFQRHDRS